MHILVWECFAMFKVYLSMSDQFNIMNTILKNININILFS